MRYLIRVGVSLERNWGRKREGVFIHRQETSEEIHGPSLVLTADPKPRLCWRRGLREVRALLSLNLLHCCSCSSSSCLLKSFQRVQCDNRVKVVSEHCSLRKRYKKEKMSEKGKGFRNWDQWKKRGNDPSLIDFFVVWARKKRGIFLF